MIDDYTTGYMNPRHPCNDDIELEQCTQCNYYVNKDRLENGICDECRNLEEDEEDNEV